MPPLHCRSQGLLTFRTKNAATLMAATGQPLRPVTAEEEAARQVQIDAQSRYLGELEDEAILAAHLAARHVADSKVGVGSEAEMEVEVEVRDYKSESGGDDNDLDGQSLIDV